MYTPTESLLEQWKDSLSEFYVVSVSLNELCFMMSYEAIKLILLH